MNIVTSNEFVNKLCKCGALPVDANRIPTRYPVTVTAESGSVVVITFSVFADRKLVESMQEPTE